MKKSKLNKIIFVIFLIVNLIFVSSVCFANDIVPGNWKPGAGGGNSTLEKKASTVLGIINVIGVVCSVIILGIVGLKYMVGSIEEKAEFKETAKPYIIGAVLTFSATTIVNIVYKIATKL